MENYESNPYCESETMAGITILLVALNNGHDSFIGEMRLSKLSVKLCQRDKRLHKR